MEQYPSHDINPNDKGLDWLIKYANAAWRDSANNMGDIFYRAAAKYKEHKDYALGRQSTVGYKAKWINEKGETYANINFEQIRPIISKFRDIAISKLLQRDFNITATPINPLAKDEADKYFADVKVKILMRDTLQKVNPELANAPALQKEPKEAENLEELEMQMNYGWKHNMAIEAEEGFQLVAYQNNLQELRKEVITSLFDDGVGGYKEYIDENNQIKFRAVNPANIVTSYCRKADFRDAVHVGEVIEVDDFDLAAIFNEEQMREIKSAATTEIAYNPTRVTLTKEQNKIAVLDLELITWDDKVYQKGITPAGNLAVSKADYGKKFKDRNITVNGKEEPKYVSKTVKNVYKIKWIIGTKYAYDYGLATNMKRESDVKYMADTCLSYHLYAYNFYEMRAQGIMERLIPILDEYQDTIYRIQNFKQQWMPYIVDIDLDALDNVALGLGGKAMQPMEILDMLKQTNILVGRKRDVGNNNQNYKSVDVFETPMSNEFVTLVGDLSRIINDIRDITGLNELTDGSTPNAKTLVPVANMANESTNNALYPITYAEKTLLERLAKGVIQRIQTVIKNGGSVEGIVHALGSSTVKFFSVSPNIPLYVYGIMIEDKPTDQQRQMLLEKLNLKDSQGLIDPEDYVMVMNTQNLKAAEQRLAYKVKKNKEQQQQQAMVMQQQNGQIQMQSAQAAEQAKQQTLQVEYQLKSQLEVQLKQMDMEMLKMKLAGGMQMNEQSMGGKLLGQTMQHHADERQAKIDQGIPVEPMDAGMQNPAEEQAEGPQQQNPAEEQAEMPQQQVAQGVM